MRTCICVRLFLVIATTIFVGELLAAPDEPTRWYVAVDGNDENDGSEKRPFASLERARLALRDWIAQGGSGDVEVLIGAGHFELSDTLVFSPADSAPPGATITYVARPNAPATLSGGVRVLNWQKSGDVWEADTKLQGLHRSLFIGDERPTRAREPDEGFFRVAQAGADQRTRFQFDSAEWPNPTFEPAMELVFLHDWSTSRVAVREVNAGANEIVLSDPIGANHDFFRIDGFEPNPRYFLEHARAFIDEPLEWFHDQDAGKLILKLAVDDSPDRHSITIPRLECLIKIVGEPNKPVRGLRFRGLRFADTSCPIPSGGCAEVQASFFQRRKSADAPNLVGDPNAETGNLRLPAAIMLEFASECAIDGCTLRRFGGGGIYLGRECYENRIENCQLSDIGGCGIMIGETSTRTSADGNNHDCAKNVVARNRISNCGTILYGSVGVWIGIARDTQVNDNEIHHLPYTGVSVGWCWDATPTGCAGNQIVGNHIHHVMNTLSDGGGIYTLGRQPGTILKSNRIHDVLLNAGRADSNGIFMDEGSSQIEVCENTIFNIARSPIRFHKALENKLSRNQLFTAPGVEPFTYNSTDPANITFVENEVRERNPD